MAYVPGQKLGEEDQNQSGAPSVGAPDAPGIGSTPSVGGSAVGSSPVANSTGLGSSGTGFTNIDAYLGANKGAGSAIGAAGGKALADDAGAFGAENRKVQTNVSAQNKPIVDPNKVTDSVVNGGVDAVKTAQDIVNNKFQGPAAVDYNVGNTDKVKQANALGNAASAGKQLAIQNGTVGQYGTGLSAIDAAIYGSQQERGAGVDAVKTAAGAQVADQNAAKGATDKSATDLTKKIADTADAQKKSLQAAAGGLQTDAQQKADAANNQQASDLANGTVRDPNTGQVVVGANAQPGGWENGTGQATAANFINANGLSNIGAALGDTGMAATKAGPAFVSGRNTTAATTGHNDVAGPVQNVLTKPNAPPQQPQTTQQIAQATKGLSAEQLASYQQIRRDNPTLTAAQAAEDARNGNNANQLKYGNNNLATRSVPQ